MKKKQRNYREGLLEAVQDPQEDVLAEQQTDSAEDVALSAIADPAFAKASADRSA